MVSFLANTRAHSELIDQIQQRKEHIAFHLDQNPEDVYALLEAIRLEFEFLEKHKIIATLSEEEKSQLTKDQILDVIKALLQENAMSANIFLSTRLQRRIEHFIHLKAMPVIRRIAQEIEPLQAIFERLPRDTQQHVVNLQSLVVKLVPLSLQASEKDMITARCYQYLSGNFQAMPLETTNVYSSCCQMLQNLQNKENSDLDKVLFDISLKASLKKYSVEDITKLPKSVFDVLQARHQEIASAETLMLQGKGIVPLPLIFERVHALVHANPLLDGKITSHLDFLAFLHATLGAYRVMLRKEVVISMMKFNHICSLVQELCFFLPEKKDELEAKLLQLRDSKKMDAIRTQEFLGLQNILGKEEELESKIKFECEECVMMYQETLKLIDNCVEMIKSQGRLLLEQNQEKYQALLENLGEIIMLWEKNPRGYELFIELRRFLEAPWLQSKDFQTLDDLSAMLKKIVQEDHETYFRENVASEGLAEVLQVLSL